MLIVTAQNRNTKDSVPFIVNEIGRTKTIVTKEVTEIAVRQKTKGKETRIARTEPN